MNFSEYCYSRIEFLFSAPVRWILKETCLLRNRFVSAIYSNPMAILEYKSFTTAGLLRKMRTKNVTFSPR